MCRGASNMGLNQHLLEMAKASIKRANFESNTPPLVPAQTPPTRGPMGPGIAGHLSRSAGHLGMAGLKSVGMAARHPILSAGLPLAAYGAYKLHEGMTEPDTDKQADVPPTPMSAPTTTSGMPPAPVPPPTNAAPMPPSPPQSFGSIQASPVQQTDQMQPPVTTSQGANVPSSGQGAAQRAPGLVTPMGK